MRAVIVLFALAAPAHAQELPCPKRHPEAPAARLMGGSMYLGAEHEAELIGTRSKVRGGYDVQHGFAPSDVKWLACWYEGRQVRCRRMDSPATDCKLESRGRRAVCVKLTCK